MFLEVWEMIQLLVDIILLQHVVNGISPVCLLDIGMDTMYAFPGIDTRCVRSLV